MPFHLPHPAKSPFKPRVFGVPVSNEQLDAKPSAAVGGGVARIL